MVGLTFNDLKYLNFKFVSRDNNTYVKVVIIKFIAYQMQTIAKYHEHLCAYVCITRSFVRRVG